MSSDSFNPSIPPPLPFAPETAALPPPLPEPLNGRVATWIFVVYFAAQLAIGFFIGLVAGLAGASGNAAGGRAAVQELVQSMMLPAAVISTLLGSIAYIAMSISVAGKGLRGRRPIDAAWVAGSWKHIPPALITGLLLGVIYLMLASMFPHWSRGESPMSRLVMTPGLSQNCWIFLALVLAPIFEELLFRGVLYGGYRQSLGPRWAAGLTIGIFVALHLSEMIYFLPSIAFITALAAIALWVRLKTAAIGPAIAVHFGYNLVLVVAVVWATQGK